MRHLYHICLSAGDEIMYRSEEDFIRAFNCYAVALYRTGSNSLADSFMSNHFHACVETDSVRDLIFYYRTAYARYFNKKYLRHGSLGERLPFVIDVVGLYHRLAALSYTKRNALHHGVSPTPFAYRHNSSNAVFRKELGKLPVTDLLARKNYYKYLPSKADVPDHYKMNVNGLLLRETVMDVQQVEYIYNTPRNYMYYMNRMSGEEWEKEQERDNGFPLTLENIEAGVNMNKISSMLRNEFGREDYNNLSDIRLCEIIDLEILPMHGLTSVYQLDLQTKTSIANELILKYRVGKDKIKRCLVF